jgi:hypothetical protein
MVGIQHTICPHCGKLVHKEPGFCALCGQVLSPKPVIPVGFDTDELIRELTVA